MLGSKLPNSLAAHCAMGVQSFKLAAVLTIGNEMLGGPKAILQVICPFAFGALLVFFFFLFFLLFFFIITSHILNVLGKAKNGL